RMETYRLSWKLAAGADNEEISGIRQSLQQRLNSQTLKAVLEDGRNAELEASYQQLQLFWQQTLIPALERNDAAAFQASALPFVEQLNQFVNLLQRQSEHKQTWQQLIQGAALFITMIVLLVGLHELQSNVISPLQELVDATQRFRRGEFQA
ncbi:MCP four helix bundle domain-containing protein, partial [Neisseria cinerea]